jgi:hypothetical protein
LITRGKQLVERVDVEEGVGEAFEFPRRGCTKAFHDVSG